MLELLNQRDGFDSRGDVKVILATNKIETLDPALLRPGRIDRKIEFPLPDIKTRRRIFQVNGWHDCTETRLQLYEFQPVLPFLELFCKANVYVSNADTHIKDDVC